MDTVEELWQAADEGIPNTTVLIADGVYNLGQNGYYLWLDTPNITLRSLSGNRASVVLDDNYSASEIVSILASNVTVADLTIRRAGTHAIHVMSSDSGDTLNTLINNVLVEDPGQQGIKINPHTARIYFPDRGEIACSQITLSGTGRAKVWEINGSCYTGGIDAHAARDWVVRDNIIQGFWCAQGLSEYAIHLWIGSRDPLVMRNRLVDNARGIGLGLVQNGSARLYADNPCPTASGYVDHYGGVVRDNFIAAAHADLFLSEYGFDCGICLAQACAARLLHNSVFSSQAPFSSIEWRFENTSAEITNNLLSHNLRERDGATAVLAGNLEYAPVGLIVDLFNSDLHLRESAAAAINQGAPLYSGVCETDIDGDLRPVGLGRDIGADERPTAAACWQAALPYVQH